MENDNYVHIPEINFPITMNEIDIVKRARGVDNVPNENVKNQDVLIMLYILFRNILMGVYCHQYGLKL